MPDLTPETLAELRDQIAATIHRRICEHSREDCIENLGNCERATDSAMPLISTALDEGKVDGALDAAAERDALRDEAARKARIASHDWAGVRAARVFAVFVVAPWRTDRGWYCQAQHPHPTRLDADLCDARRYEADRLRRESDAYADAAREGLAAGTWPAFPRTNARTEGDPR